MRSNPWYYSETTALGGRNHMTKGTYRGVVRGGVVLPAEEMPLADGTEVFVTPTALLTPLKHEPGSPLAVLAAMRAEPHVTQEDVAELERAIAAGKRPAATIDPFAEDRPGTD
jgi:hypothetical protein